MPPVRPCRYHKERESNPTAHGDLCAECRVTRLHKPVARARAERGSKITPTDGKGNAKLTAWSENKSLDSFT